MFNTFILIPLTNSLVFLTSFLWGNIGLAVIILTILVKFVLLPFSYSTTKNQIAIKKIQPLIDDIKKKHPDSTEQTKKIMELYKEHNTNPLSGCLPLLIQLPIIVGLYQVFLKGVSVDPALLYSFVHAPEQLSNMFLGLNMTDKSILVALIAGITQYFQLKLSPSFQNTTSGVSTDTSPDMQTVMMENMQKTMKYSLPVMITFFAAIVPAAVALYWVTSNIFMIGQEYWINKKLQQKNTL